jgi:AhpD family alkylhydroperoxidase
MKEAAASACTDITGFGLFAHLRRMLRGSGLGAELFAEALPAFAGAVEALRQGIIPGAVERNREYVGDALRAGPGVDEALVNLGFDAQTSGGLLIAVPEERLSLLRQALARRGLDGFVIGRLTSQPDGEILLSPGSRPARKEHPMKESTNDSVASHDDCCADVFNSEAAQSTVTETQKAFGAMMRAMQSAGALSEKAKELILFALVVSSRCQPCFAAHYRKARELGITQAELDEAAWCAIAMGGAPVKMFYQECLERLAQAKTGE